MLVQTDVSTIGESSLFIGKGEDMVEDVEKMMQVAEENSNRTKTILDDKDNETKENLSLLRKKALSFCSYMTAVATVRINELPWYKKISKKILDFFFRLTIAKKMLFGYCSLLSLIVFISLFALINLNRLNSLNDGILKKDIPIINASNELIDIVFDQELFASRYVILNTPDVMEIFWEKSTEFEKIAKSIKEIAGNDSFLINRIISLHDEFNEIVIQGIASFDASSSLDIEEFEDKVKVKQETLISMIKELSDDALGEQIAKTGATATIGELAFRAAAIMCGIGFIFSVVAAMLITKNISGNIAKLKIATEMIAKGNFDYRPDIRTTDELQYLSKAFITMSDRLRNLEEKNLDTSPLTRLPGGVSIENVLDTHIKTQTPFAFCLMDLDNFKAFNDRYGYAKGNQLIKSTAKTIQKVVSEFGSGDDFVGHIGGDDFVLISTPERCGKICDEIIGDFNKDVAKFYNTEDNSRGYIIGENRQGQRTFFPLASLSIAVVTDTENKMESFIKVGEIAAELKEYAKSKTGSVCVFDKRTGDQDSNVFENVIEFPKTKEQLQESNIC